MTLAGDGSATLAYRVSIDGCPSDAVTHPEMVKAASAGHPSRLDGLKLKDAKFGVACDPISGKVTSNGVRVTIVDVDAQWSAVFGKSPSNTTWLTADVTDADTTIPVSSTAGFASNGYIWIDSECIYYGSKDATNFLTCTRGMLSDDIDAATYHYANGGSERARSPEVTDWPVLWEQRRVRVWRYDETSDLQGNGTQIYLGKVTTAPKSSGTTWSIGTDSIVGILEQTLGADLSEAAYPRGVYYPPESPLNIVIFEDPAGANTKAPVTLSGFFETQDLFCAALQVQVNAAQTAAGQLNKITIVSDGPAGWHATLTTAAAPNHKFVRFGSGRRISAIDHVYGAFDGFPQNEDGTYIGSTISASSTYYYWPSEGYVTPAAGFAGHLIGAIGPPGAGTVPRGVFNVLSSAEMRTIYLGGASPVSSLISSILVEWQPPDGSSSTYVDTYALSSVDNAARSLTMQIASFADGGTVAVIPGGAPTRIYTSELMPSIRFGLLLSSTGGSSSYDLMNNITILQAQYAPLGVVPMLRAGDWDPAAWYDNAVAGQPELVTRRLYTTFAPLAIGELIREELKAAQCFLAVDSAGRMVPKPLRLPVGSEFADVATIDQSTLLTDESLLDLETSGLGQINTVNFKTGYDAQEDKFNGRTVRVRDVAAFGQSPSVRTMSIAPKSVYLGTPLTDDVAVQCSAGIFGAFAGPYQIVQLAVAMAPDVACGDPVVFDNPHYPDSDGELGVVGKVGMVLAVDRKAYSPRTNVAVLTTPQKVGGYAPGAVVASSVGATTSWVLTLDTTTYPGGSDNTDWWEVGDRVRVVELDTLTGTVVVGIVTASSSASVSIAFDSAWSGASSGTKFWYLTMANASDATLQLSQRRFTSIADSDGVIQYTADPDPAFRFNA